MAQTFRPYPEKGADTQGHFRPTQFLIETVTNGPFHFLWILPHVIIPIYGVYRILKQNGYWTSQVDYAIDTILIPLLQGSSVGGVLGTSFLRYGTASGRRISNKRADDAATHSESKDQYRIELALWVFIYIGFSTILWQQFPAANGPGITAVKRFAGRVGVDLGKMWNTRHSWQD